MSLAYAVVAHHERACETYELAALLNASVVMDDLGLGAAGNHRRALALGIASGASHICVLEDDALPIDGLRDHVEAAVAHKPDDLISLYVGTGRRGLAREVEAAVTRASRHGAAWIVADRLLHGVAVIWPTALAAEYLAVEQVGPLWDAPISRWLRDTGRTAHHTWPSLVDHADNPSVIPMADRLNPQAYLARHAYLVGVPDWTGAEVRL